MYGYVHGKAPTQWLLIFKEITIRSITLASRPPFLYFQSKEMASFIMEKGGSQKLPLCEAATHVQSSPCVLRPSSADHCPLTAARRPPPVDCRLPSTVHRPWTIDFWSLAIDHRPAIYFGKEYLGKKEYFGHIGIEILIFDETFYFLIS